MLWCQRIRFFISLNIITCFCSMISYLQSGASIHRCFENIKEAWKSVVLALFCDFSADNLSRTEVAKYITFVSSYWKIHREHFLIKNYFLIKFTCVGDFLVNEFFEFWHQFMCYSNNLTGETFIACLVFFAWFISIYSIKCQFVNIDKNEKWKEVIFITSPATSLENVFNLIPLLITTTLSNS